MMTMRVSGVLPPPPSYPASCGLSRLSLASSAVLPPPLVEPEVDYPMFTDDEYHALMLAEFGPLMPLLTQEEVQSSMVLAENEPLLPEDESQATIADENEMEACPPIPPCPDNKEGRKKRKRPPPPCTEIEDDIDEPSPKRSNEIDDDDDELPSPRATNKMMATCLLKRRYSAPEPSEPEGQTVLWCQCQELPRDSPGCALHQAAPFQSWMLDQDQIPDVGSNDGVMVPKRPTERKKTVLKYIRWRSKVWMPSRFYVEHVQAEMALQEEEQY